MNYLYFRYLQEGVIKILCELVHFYEDIVCSSLSNKKAPLKGTFIYII